MTGQTRLSASGLIAAVVDAGSFRSWDSPVTHRAAAPEYAAQLAAAEAASGTDESIITGEATVEGHPVALIVGEFGFLAGSVGRAAASRLVHAVETATTRRLPLLASPVSGGTRMQEGTLGFMSMVAIASALQAHRASGLPYLVYLRHPTTGGTYASWGSLGHITVAEPGALVGLIGPRVYRALRGRDFPAGVQVAENLFRRGLVDAVMPPRRLRNAIHRVLSVTRPRETASVSPPATLTFEAPEAPVWESVRISRSPRRPTVRHLLRSAADDVSLLSGSGQGERESGLILALARFGEAPCVVVGQDRLRRRATTHLGAGALREARRGIRIAAELNLPMVMIIDTPGAALSRHAEEGGLGGEIARCLADLTMLPVPTVSLLLGQGAGGGAIALLPADRVLAAQHAWLSPLSPEGASVIVHRTRRHAAQMAANQQIGVGGLLAHGIVDHVIDERPDAADEPDAFCSRAATAIEYELTRLTAQDGGARSRERLLRYRRLCDA